ncbi:unnamed protein product [Prunus armeniaca]|uniref:HotDog ACOT-type domain-containing protein n=1 Tax=Prunus armeniaca TaxID=36596 RepID=A0A6J5VRX1_PRUAR|nr:unnamed protein product [Prunus armeniaca]
MPLHKANGSQKLHLKEGQAFCITFSSDYISREHYRDPWNEVRIGRLLQDLDALATTISVKHCSDDGSKTRPLFLVTAAVDKIVLKKPLSVSIDMKIVEDPEDDSDSVALTATFICVAIDSKTGEAVPVNRILPETKQEKALLEETEAQNSLRKSKRGKELVNGEPQHRNMHGRVFGGFLMHRAFELAFSTAYAFAGLVPCFSEVDHIEFLKPVDVGDFLRFKTCVLYKKPEDPEQPLIHVEVVAHVTSPEKRSAEVSNTFYFSFTVRPEAKVTMKKDLKIKNVIPETEEEARPMVGLKKKRQQLDGEYI